RGTRLVVRLAGVLDRLAQCGRPAGVHEVVQRTLLLDLGQIANDGAAQPGQEPCEQEGDQPPAAAEPFFRQPQGIAHDVFSPPARTIHRPGVTLAAAQPYATNTVTTPVSPYRWWRAISPPAKKPTSGTSPGARRTICSSALSPPKWGPPRPEQLT